MGLKRFESPYPVCYSKFLCFVWPFFICFNTAQDDFIKRVIIFAKMCCNGGSVRYTCFPIRTMKVRAFSQSHFCLTNILFVSHITRHEVHCISCFAVVGILDILLYVWVGCIILHVWQRAVLHGTDSPGTCFTVSGVILARTSMSVSLLYLFF